jgi:hypothetical protein
LYIAGINDTAIACTVMVSHAALIGDGNCFKTFMRMNIYASLLF